MLAAVNANATIYTLVYDEIDPMAEEAEEVDTFYGLTYD